MRRNINEHVEHIVLPSLESAVAAMGDRWLEAAVTNDELDVEAWVKSLVRARRELTKVIRGAKEIISARRAVKAER